MKKLIPDFHTDWYENFISNSNEKELISQRLQEQLKRMSKSKCLEIGVGTEPIFYNFLSKLVDQYDVIEREITDSIKNSSVNLIEGDWENIEVNEKYDVIICSHVLYYFRNKPKAIEKMLQCLNPNGKIFFVVNGNEKDYAKIKSFFSSLIDIEYIPTYLTLKNILEDNFSVIKKESSFTTFVNFDTGEDLYNILRLSFDLHTEEYKKYKKEIEEFITENFLNNVFEIEQKMLVVSKKEDWSRLLNHEKHELEFGEVVIDVEDKVFTPNPQLTYSSSIIIDNFPDVEGKTVADVGSGSGILSVYAGKMGAKYVLATDISRDAIKNTRNNAHKNNLTNIRVKQTSLLNDVDKKFNYIFANLPIKDEVWDIDAKLLFEQLLIGLKSKVYDDSKVYIPWGSFAEEERGYLEEQFKVHGWDYNLIQKDHLGITWYLYILSGS